MHIQWQNQQFPPAIVKPVACTLHGGIQSHRELWYAHMGVPVCYMHVSNDHMCMLINPTWGHYQGIKLLFVEGSSQSLSFSVTYLELNALLPQ